MSLGTATRSFGTNRKRTWDSSGAPDLRSIVEGRFFRQSVCGSQNSMATHEFQIIPPSFSSCVLSAQTGLSNNRQPASHAVESEYVFNFGACVHLGSSVESSGQIKRMPVLSTKRGSPHRIQRTWLQRRLDLGLLPIGFESSRMCRKGAGKVRENGYKRSTLPPLCRSDECLQFFR